MGINKRYFYACLAHVEWDHICFSEMYYLLGIATLGDPLSADTLMS